MRDRLTELLEQTGMLESKTRCEIAAEELLGNGVIVPPCKVGTTIYMIVEKRAKVTRAYFHFVKKTKLTYLNLERVINNWGKTVFLTKEEAEQALGKLQASYEQVKGGVQE